MPAPLKLATVGTGYFSQFHYEAWARIEAVDLVGICTLDEAVGRNIAARFDVERVHRDLDEMLDETRPDLLDIISPPPTHRTFIEAAVVRGIPVICQKPFTRDLKEAEAVAAMAESAGVTIAVHENFRFQPWYEHLKTLLEDGEAGTVRRMGFHLRPGDGQGPEAYLDRQPYFQKMERFLIHETAIHFIDVFRFLMGEVTSVYADLTRCNPYIAGEDSGLVTFRFENGAAGLFDGNRLLDHPAENRRLPMGEMLIEGDGGTLRLDGDGYVFRRAHGDNAEYPVPYDWTDRGFAGDSVYRLQCHVVEHLLGGSELVNGAADYLANLRVEAAIYRSNEEGRRIDL